MPKKYSILNSSGANLQTIHKDCLGEREREISKRKCWKYRVEPKQSAIKKDILRTQIIDEAQQISINSQEKKTFKVEGVCMPCELQHRFSKRGPSYNEKRKQKSKKGETFIASNFHDVI